MEHEWQANAAWQVNPLYYKGELTTCGSSWRFDNIHVGFDKFYFIVEGSCMIEIDGHKHLAKPYQLFLLPGHTAQTLYTLEDQTIKKYWFHCALPCGEQTLSEVLHLPYYIEVPDVAYIQQLFCRILKGEKEPALTAKLQQKAAILELVAYYVQHSGTRSSTVSYDSRITQVLDYIEDHLTDDLPLDDLCQLVHFQPSYFIRFFKSATGATPAAYIQSRRVALAQQLLLDQTLSIQDISARCGFRNPPYFSRCFKKWTGLSPTRYQSLAIKRHVNTDP